MSQVVCYPSPGKLKGMRLSQSFARGCGGRVLPEGHPRLEPGAAFFYGWTGHSATLIERCRAEGRTWFYADNAYYFGRGRCFRVTKDALMHDGSGDAGPARFEAFGLKVKPWRKDGRHIVVATQSDLFHRIFGGGSRELWADGVKAEISRHTERPVVVCHKPPSPWPAEGPHMNVEQALPGAWAVVAYSSSVMVKALLEGIPVFSLAPSMASRMGLSDLSGIEAPYRPADRESWLWNLAANQWTPVEMLTGLCWRMLQDQTERAA